MLHPIPPGQHGAVCLTARQELPLGRGLRGVVTGGDQEPVRQGQLVDRAQRQKILSGKRTRRVRQVVLGADRPHTLGDLRVAVARQVGIQVVFDLVAQVAAGERQNRAGVEVRGTENLTQVPLTSGLVLEDVGAVEALEAQGQAAAELAGADLESQFMALEGSDDVDDELASLRQRLAGGPEAVALPSGDGATVEPVKVSEVDADLEELKKSIDKL